MSRLRRELIEGGLHHVFDRLARAEELLADPVETIGFIDRLHEIKANERLEGLRPAERKR